MPLRSFAKFKLILSRHSKELRGALGHRLFGLCVNPTLSLTVLSLKPFLWAGA